MSRLILIKQGEVSLVFLSFETSKYNEEAEK